MPIRPVSLLIVDDDESLARMLDDAALARGFRAECSTSLAAVNAALDQRAFDVALVDLVLGAESGFDVIRRIKNLTPDTEIVVLSASVARLRHPFVRVVRVRIRQKPFDIDQLFTTIERAMERRG
jgi:two-component system nitrogen regulation response regulator GlnG